MQKARANFALNLKYHRDQYNKSNAFVSNSTTQSSGRVRAVGLRILSFNNGPIIARVGLSVIDDALRDPLGQDGIGDLNIGTKV